MKGVLKRLLVEEFNSLLYMNLVTALLCLPVVTAGPALLALLGTMIKILDGRCELRRMKEYKRLLKAKFWRGVVLEVLVAVYVLGVLWVYSVSKYLPALQRELLLALTAVVVFLAALVSIWLPLILSAVRCPFGQALWNSVCLAVGRLPRTLLSTVCVYGILVLCVLFYPISILPAAVILISFAAALSVTLLWKPLEQLVLNDCANG